MTCYDTAMSTSSRTVLMQQAADHLKAHDPLLGQVIREVGLCTIEPHTNYYQELVDSIISQQLSIKAAASILKRFRQLFDNQLPTPAQILTKDVDELRAVGLSRAKALYVQDLARHILDGTVRIEQLPNLSNEEVIAELTAVKGIGEWTAHMFLMFSLGRLDILATGDLGVRNGVKKVYNLPDTPTPIEVREVSLKNHWAPYESIACWYMWQALTL